MKNAVKRLLRDEQPELLYSELIAKINSIKLGGSDATQLKALIDASKEKASSEKDDLALLLAAVKEVIFRATGLLLFNSQLAASLSILDGHVAELPTGEGKTLAAVTAASVMAIEGHSAHVLVFNDYLAKRDFLLSQPVYAFLGLSSGFIQEGTPAKERRKQYECNILYIAAKEAGFDLLRDFLCRREEELLDFPQDCAIVDEADSILIDEAKIPLVLAGSAPEEPLSVNAIALAVKELIGGEVSVNLPAKQVYLTDEGIRHTEATLSVDLYAEGNANILSMVNAALQAKYLLSRDRDYLVKENSVFVIDEFTGRVAVNRKFPDILQAAVEAKEQLTPSRSSMVYHTMTVRDYLLRYDRLSGMTGTARDSAEEFDALYGLAVDVIPPNKPCRRIDRESLIFRTYDEKMQAAAEEIKKAHSTGEPILIGTQSVEESELLSAMLQRAGIIHSVLNAKNDEEEAELIGKAGELFRVTVSTNMAGRGVDIKLGGRTEQDREKVLETGGLYVIGTGINRSTRIDDQLRGRAGRQGDAGRSRFFLSLEDPILKPYDLKQQPQREGSAPLIGDRHILKTVKRIQRYAEGEDAEARYMLSKYTYIQEQQREMISELRRSVLAGNKHLCTLGKSNPEIFQRLVEKAGAAGVAKAEQQLSLYFINFCWARFLESMEYTRDGIHLMMIGSKNPIDEYHRIAITAFDEMMQDIGEQVDSCMVKFQITADGIDLKQNGLNGATTTWTYLIDESSSQFSRIPYLVKTVSNRIKGAVFTVQGLFHRS